MQRSRKLGHCICDPRRPCPCDVFTEQGICPCAGERPDPLDLSQVRLTQMVHNAGCASKIAPADLEAILARLPAVDDPAVISGMPAGDDAGIYRLNNGTCIVQTVDVMTPCVDDPETFGRICAANCLSDIYAMGGVPKTALSVLAFPSETLDGRIMYGMMKGAMDVFAEAGVALIGGHSIKDEEIKLGFAITGTIDPQAETSHETAAIGDVLVLTKPLGSGVLNFSRQIGRDVDLAPVEKSMAALNRDAADAARETGVSACTDVTGFGLFGHLISMVRHSGVTALIYADALPAFAGAVESLADGVVPGAVERNTEYVGGDIAVADGVPEPLVHLGFDAQTSGGLLIAVPQQRHQKLLDALAARGVSGWTVGRITEKSDGRILVTLAGKSAAGMKTASDLADDAPSGHTDKTAKACCSEPADSPAEASQDAQRAFASLMRATGQGGAVDEKTKELINFALVVLARCGPCIDAHLAKARKMGITQQQLDEAAWCAVAMGGAPVKMFYAEAMAREKQKGKSGDDCCC